MPETILLHAQANRKAIPKGLSLAIDVGELPTIIVPNGSGKSTLGEAERKR